MGQEQSLGRTNTTATLAAQHEGFRLVQAGARTGAGEVQSDPLVREIEALPLPYPVLPPPPVPDDVSSALSGAQMMHELRAAFGNMLPGTGSESNPSSPREDLVDGSDSTSSHRGHRDSSGQSRGAASQAPQDLDDTGGDSAESKDDSEAPKMDSEQARLAQEKWSRAVLDLSAVESAVTAAGGGEALRKVLDEQERLLEMVQKIRVSAERVQHAMEATEKEAVRTRKALQSLERLHLAAADVQDALEAGVATANILGASHFPHDEEMRSFKDYLRHHPPNYADVD